MTATNWWTYLQSLMGDQTAKEAAEVTGVSASNFTRWKKGARADPDFVVKIARAYDTNVLRALVEAEFITAEEAGAGIAAEEFSYFDKLSDAAASASAASTLFEIATQELRRFHAVQLGAEPQEVERISNLELEDLIRRLRSQKPIKDELASRRSNRNALSAQPIEEDELAEAIREANERPQAAHPATEELIEPENP